MTDQPSAPSADEQTAGEREIRLLADRLERTWRTAPNDASWSDLKMAADKFRSLLSALNQSVAELTSLRAELDAQKTTSHLRLEAALHEERNRKSAETEVARLRAERDNFYMNSRAAEAQQRIEVEAKHTALLIDLRALVEQWRQFAINVRSSEECSAVMRCYNDLRARLSREPHHDTPQ